MTVYGLCEKCGLVVESPQTPAYPIRGWEVGRTGGGANAIKNRERIPGRVRHNTCIPGADEPKQIPGQMRLA
jgi:hypothetical protein